MTTITGEVKGRAVKFLNEEDKVYNHNCFEVQFIGETIWESIEHGEGIYKVGNIYIIKANKEIDTRTTKESALKLVGNIY